jgi:hypothetical protein
MQAVGGALAPNVRQRPCAQTVNRSRGSRIARMSGASHPKVVIERRAAAPQIASGALPSAVLETSHGGYAAVAGAPRDPLASRAAGVGVVERRRDGPERPNACQRRSFSRWRENSSTAPRARSRKPASSRRLPPSQRSRSARALPPRLDSPLLFPAPRGGSIGLDTWRAGEWYPALEAAGIEQRGPYHPRQTSPRRRWPRA